MISLALLVASVLLSTQLILAILAHFSTRSENEESLGTPIVELLQLFSRIHTSLDIKVNANLKRTAVMQDGVLWLNREHVYRTDLGSTLIVLSAILRHHHIIGPELSKLQKIQTYLFALQIISFIFGFFFINAFWVATTLAVILLLFSYYYERRFIKWQNDVVEVAVDLLNLDEGQMKRFTDFASKFQGEGFLYPLVLAQGIFKFFVSI